MRGLLKDVSRDELLSMRSSGMTNRDIANALGVNYQTVLRYIGKQPSPSEWRVISTTPPESPREDAAERPQEPQEASPTGEQVFTEAEEAERSERQFAPVERIMAGDIWTWLHDVGNRVFRYWTYKRMFTPYEQQRAFMDESQYEDTHCRLGIIKECVVLPNNDILIGFLNVNDDDDPELPPYIDYRKLSEISLAFSAADQKCWED